MIRLCRVGHIGTAQRWHVAVDARAVSRGSRLLLQAQRTGLIGVATCALVPIPSVPGFRFWFEMGVVARGATQSLLRSDVTATGSHLFDMADNLMPPSLVDPVISFQDDKDILQSITRSKVKKTSPRTPDHVLPLQVALVADIFAATGIQLGGIDDRIILQRHLAGDAVGSTPLVQRDVVTTRPMATLAPDRGLRKCGLLVTVFAHAPDTPRMTIKTAVPDTPRKARVISRFISRRKVPTVGLRIPPQGRLIKGFTLTDQVRTSLLARPDSDGDLLPLVINQFSRLVAQQFVMEDCPIGRSDLVLTSAVGGDRARRNGLDRTGQRQRVQGPRHRVRGIPCRNLGVARDTRVAPDIIGRTRGWGASIDDGDLGWGRFSGCR